MAVTIGFGNLSLGGAVLEASDGTKIAVFVSSQAIKVWKDIDGTPSQVGSSQVPATVHGDVTGTPGWIDAAIDSNDDIHVISSCASEQTRDVAYAVCDLTTGFGTWEEAADYTEAVPNTPGCAISIDSNDYPHILFVDRVKQTGATGDNVYYTNNESGWLSPEQVGTRANKVYSYSFPKISHAPADDVEAWYYYNSQSDPAYKRRNGTWSSESTYAEANSYLGPVTVTTGNTVYRYHGNWDTDIKENNVDTTYNQLSINKYLSASLVGTDRYIFYIDSNVDVRVISNDGGGWTDESAQQTGTYERVIAEWAYNNENQSGEINYIFDDGTNVYYDSFTISTGTQVYKDTQLKWDMRELVSDDLQIKYDMFELISDDIQAKWDIFKLVNKDTQAKWDIFELVGQEVQAKWDIRELVGQNIEAVWDILSLGTQVFKDIQAKWDIRGLVNQSTQAKWDINNLVNQTIQAKYDIFELIGDEIQAKWDILNLAGQELQAKWDISILVTKSIETKWDILNLVANTIQAVYDMRQLAGRSLQAKWDILGDAPPDEDGGKRSLRQMAYRWTSRMGR